MLKSRIKNLGYIGVSNYQPKQSPTDYFTNSELDSLPPNAL